MKGWRTLAFNLGLVVVGTLQAADWTAILGASPYTGYVVMAIGVVGTVLRSVTTSPMGTK